MRLHEEKIITTDCDGCLLNWNNTFSAWMVEQGHTLVNPNAYDISARYNLKPGHGDLLVRRFNDVEKAVGTLPAWGDSVAFVRKLHFVHGYRFVVISAVSETPHTALLRRENLYRVFGPECFSHIVCIKIGGDKTDALRPYKHSQKFWIEDNLKNAELGHRMGLKTLLIDAAYNGSNELPFPRVKNWAEIYEKIVQSEQKVA
jgi:hypothetical protein